MKFKFEAIIDTDNMEIEIKKVKELAEPGRPRYAPSRIAALVLADAWGNHNFTKKKGSKEQRIGEALQGQYSDGGAQRRAIRGAKHRKTVLFNSPHAPGFILIGRDVAIWFSNKVTHYPAKETEPEIYIGYGWAWKPGMKDAICNHLRATNEGK